MGPTQHISKIRKVLENLRRKHYFILKQTQIYEMEYKIVERMNDIKVNCYKKYCA